MEGSTPGALARDLISCSSSFSCRSRSRMSRSICRWLDRTVDLVSFWAALACSRGVGLGLKKFILVWVVGFAAAAAAVVACYDWFLLILFE